MEEREIDCKIPWDWEEWWSEAGVEIEIRKLGFVWLGQRRRRMSLWSTLWEKNMPTTLPASFAVQQRTKYPQIYIIIYQINLLNFFHTLIL